MKEGDLVRNKNNHCTGRIGGTLTRMVEGKTVIERVLIIAERSARVRMWCDVADVELVPDQPAPEHV
jgi:hypothetical protein